MLELRSVESEYNYSNATVFVALSIKYGKY